MSLINVINSEVSTHVVVRAVFTNIFIDKTRQPGVSNDNINVSHTPPVMITIADSIQAEYSSPELRDSHKDAVIGGQKQIIIIMLMSAPIIDPFPAWMLLLCHKEPAKGKKCQ